MSAVFAFTTKRTIVSGLRRFGQGLIADLASSTATSATTDQANLAFCATQLAAAPGDGLKCNLTPSSGTEPYALRFTSPPLWYEKVYQGIFVGTKQGEWLIRNDQIGPAGTNGVNSVQVSSVGCAADDINDYRSASTMLNGHIFFITPKGVGQLTFSNEQQTYLPQIIDLEAKGFGIPVSIASSKQYNQVLVHTRLPSLIDGVNKPSTNPSGDQIVQINALNNGIGILPVTQRLLPGSTTRYGTFYGIDTVNGEPRFAFQDPGTNPTVWYQTGLATSNVPVNIRTTKFGPMIEGRAIIRKVYLSLADTIGGRVRVVNSQNEKWIEIDYKDVEINSARIDNVGFTGYKEIAVPDLTDNKDGGKALEFNWDPSERVNLVSVTVKVEK